MTIWLGIEANNSDRAVECRSAKFATDLNRWYLRLGYFRGPEVESDWDALIAFAT